MPTRHDLKETIGDFEEAQVREIHWLRETGWALLFVLAVGASLWFFGPTFDPSRERSHPPEARVASEGEASEAPGVIVARLGTTVTDDPRGGARLLEEPAVGSPARLRGLRPGDRVVTLNTHPVTGAGDLAARVDAALGSFAIEVIEENDGGRTTYEIELASPRARSR
ncbi:MAG: hypothetical protein AB7I30_13125 [Isosphaeraceae bacterium]